MSSTSKTKYYATIAVVAACLMELVFTGIMYNPLSLFTLPIIEDLAISRTSYALTLTLMSAISAIGNFATGWLDKKIQTRGTVILGGSLMTLALFLYANAHSYAMIMASALIMGVAFSYSATAIDGTIINRWFAKHSGFICGITVTIAALGGTIFSPMVGRWITDYGWRHTFMIMVVISAITTILIGIFLRSTPEGVGCKPAFADKLTEEEKKAGQEKLYGLTLKQGFKTPGFWVSCIVWLFIGIIVFSIMQTIAIYVQDLGFDSAVAGKALAPMYTANMILPFIIGWLADRLKARFVVAGGLALFTIACIILWTAPTQLGLIYVVAICTGCGIATGRSLIPIHAKQVFGTRSIAGYLGILVGVFAGGISIGSVVIASFYDKFGSYSSAMPLYVPIMVVVVVIMALLSHKLGSQAKYMEMDAETEEAK